VLTNIFLKYTALIPIRILVAVVVAVVAVVVFTILMPLLDLIWALSSILVNLLPLGRVINPSLLCKGEVYLGLRVSINQARFAQKKPRFHGAFFFVYFIY
jgi:hypothetical protein